MRRALRGAAALAAVSVYLSIFLYAVGIAAAKAHLWHPMIH